MPSREQNYMTGDPEEKMCSEDMNREVIQPEINLFGNMIQNEKRNKIKRKFWGCQNLKGENSNKITKEAR